MRGCKLGKTAWKERMYRREYHGTAKKKPYRPKQVNEVEEIKTESSIQQTDNKKESSESKNE